MENVPKWSQGCDATAPSSSGGAANSSSTDKANSGDASSSNGEIPALESSIHQHQSLYEAMCQAYTEVHSTSKKLLYQLDHLVQMANQSGGAGGPAAAAAAAAAGEERKHVSLHGLFCLFSHVRFLPFHY